MHLLSNRLAVIGVIGLLTSLLFLAFLYPFRLETTSAIYSLGPLIGSPINPTANPAVSVSVSEEIIIKAPRKVTESDSPSIELNYTYSTTPPNFNNPRFIAVEAISSNFDIQPSGVISKTLQSDGGLRFAWIINPKKLGKQSIILSITGVSDVLIKEVKEVYEGRGSLRERAENGDASAVAILENISDDFVVREPFIVNIEVVNTLGVPVNILTIGFGITGLLSVIVTIFGIIEVAQKIRLQRAQANVAEEHRRVGRKRRQR
jgi:hypothetical protein